MDRTLIDQIKKNVNLVSLAFSYALVDKASPSNDARGNCPTGHSSQSGTCCNYSNDLNRWYCHSCKCHGDAADLVQYREFGGVAPENFIPAIEVLAKAAGITIGAEKSRAISSAHRQNIRTFEALTAASKYFHSCIDSEAETFLNGYGFTNETIKIFQIGYSRAKKNGCLDHLRSSGFSKDECLSTGLFKRFDTWISDAFPGRIIFPYLLRNRVYYVIARKTSRTPDNKYEDPKYKKLTNNSQKYPYISPAINNRIIFNQDAVGRGDYVIITEGITDCIALNQYGFNAISPGTTRFAKADFDLVIKLIRPDQTIYICNDSEINSSGEKGADAMARFLTHSGYLVKIISLPLLEKHHEARSRYYNIRKRIETLGSKKQT